MTNTNATKTNDTKNTASPIPGFEGIEMKSARSTFPPLVILGVGDRLAGIIESVDVREHVRGKDKKKKVEERKFYNVRLATDCKASDKDKKPRTFNAGEVVSLPGSGALDRTFDQIAKDIGGVTDPDEDGELNLLKGFAIIVTRQKDDTMKKGDFAGNKVKVYDVQYGKQKTA